MSRAISLFPGDQEKGQGGIDDFDGVITKSTYREGSYTGTGSGAGQARIFHYVTIQPEGADDAFTQWYAAGNPSQVRPSEDGESEADEGPYLVPAPGKEWRGQNDNTADALFFQALGKTGFDVLQLKDGNSSKLEGERFHFKRVDFKTVGGDNKPKLVPTRYLGKATGASSGAGKGQAKGNGSAEGLEARLTDMVTEILVAAEKPLTKAQLSSEVNKRLKDDPDRANALRLMLSDKFLKNGPFTYSGTTVSI